jgi:hypothetical protein
MEKLSLEKFSASKMNKDEMFKTKGGGQPCEYYDNHYHYIDTIHEGGVWEIHERHPYV